jgi:hypothetical protein
LSGRAPSATPPWACSLVCASESGTATGTCFEGRTCRSEGHASHAKEAHYPGLHPWLEAQGWFRFLEEHHYIHHVDTEANVNFLLPLADFLFGTLRQQLTPEELARHGSLAEARARPVGGARGKRSHNQGPDLSLAAPGHYSAE